MRAHKMNLIIFILVIFSLSVFNILNTDKPKISEIEKRVLTPMPKISAKSLKEGEFTKEYDSYFADTFIFRDTFVKISKAINEFRGIKGKDEIELITNYDKLDITLEAEDPVTILFKNNRAITLHKFYSNKATNYANALNKFTNKLNENVKVYSLLVPDQIEFIEDEKFKKLSDSQEFTIEYVKEHLDSKIKFIHIYNNLKANSDKYLYFKTDHHWTALGAYYGYVGFMNSIGMEPISLDLYEKIEAKDFLGSRYAINEKLKENPDIVQVFKYKDIDSYEYLVYINDKYLDAKLLDMTYLEKPNKYGVFLGGDKPLSKVISTNKNDKKILVIKDSFGNAFIPFLAPHYEEIYIVDPRYFKLDIYDLIEENQIDEVLFLNTIHVVSKNGFPKTLEILSEDK